MCFRSAANVLLLSTTLISQTLAFEVAAIVREINVEQGLAVVFANGQQRNVIIADKVKTLGEQVLQNTHHVLSGKRTANFYRQAFSRVLVDHHQQPKLATVLGPIRHKVVRPHMILVSGTVTHATIFTSARKSSLSMLFSWDLHMLSLPKSMDAFLVHRPASLRQQPINASGSETRTLTSQ